MTREEFLSELKECGPWSKAYLSECIRTDDGYGCCPLVAVANKKMGFRRFSNAVPVLAGHFLKLDHWEVSDIILAADNNNFAGGKETRRQLLEACGL